MIDDKMNMVQIEIVTIDIVDKSLHGSLVLPISTILWASHASVELLGLHPPSALPDTWILTEKENKLRKFNNDGKSVQMKQVIDWQL